MQYHYDVTGAEPILRDIRVYNSGALNKGTAMCSGPVATAENCGAAIIADADVLSNIIGVLNEDLTAAQALSVVATGVDKYAKLIINPFAVYLAKYSKLAADDVPTTGADTTGKTVTITQVTDHERAWVYITNVYSSTLGGFGNLFQVGSSGGGTTVLTAATSYDDNLSGNVSGDTCIVIHPDYGADVAGGSVNLASNSEDLQGYTASAAAGAGLVLATYIGSKVRPMEPLVCAKHSGYNYKSEDPDFYGDLMFSEHLLAAGGVVNTRVIT
jgi:hypothetical protein